MSPSHRIAELTAPEAAERLAAGARRSSFFRLSGADFIAFFAFLPLEAGLALVLALGLILDRALSLAPAVRRRAFGAVFRMAFFPPAPPFFGFARMRSIVFATWLMEAMPSRDESLPLRA